MSVSHAVYGLRLSVNIAIPGLIIQPRSDTGDVRVWLKSDTFPFVFVGHSAHAYSDQKGPNLNFATDSGKELFGFFYGDGARFAVRRDGSEVWADWPENYTLEDACTYLLGPIMGFVLRLRGIICLHASAVAVGGCAVVFVGASGAGKSTLAAALGLRGFPVLSDDIVALTEKPASFLVQPGYPRVNLWPDSVRALFGSEDTLPSITPTWDKRYLGLDHNGSQFARQPLPLRVIYFLGARHTVLNGRVVEEVFGREAFMSLVANTYVNHILDRDMRSREFDVLSRVVVSIPMRRVRYAFDSTALASLCGAVMGDMGRLNITKEFSVDTTPRR